MIFDNGFCGIGSKLVLLSLSSIVMICRSF
nr:MAG TPA: hypothetical protein [Caudoviricetes sp.]DAH94966.1 MAG TPA: hypothetical protein [Caudoviricetes sp.]DAL42069.1 MAG TPA_asm: hypothetical protein [Caudoviricetes sp.]DAX69366.1 MAG TPA: hypothetical protein [Caudoviricetes sp.]